MNNLKTNIFIADDHEIVINAIQFQLSQEQDIFKIVGTALNGKDALEKINSLDVDIIILDISMPKMDGIETLKSLKIKFPKIKVLVLTMYDDLKHIREMLKCGADGYLLKNKSAEYVIEALMKLRDGEDYFTNDVAQIAIRGFKPNAEEALIPNKEGVIKSITDPEAEILELLPNDLSAKEIADILCISPRTVETRKKNLMKKIGAKSMAGLITFALENGFKK